jgi:hypothetical protein
MNELVNDLTSLKPQIQLVSNLNEQITLKHSIQSKIKSKIKVNFFKKNLAGS